MAITAEDNNTTYNSTADPVSVNVFSGSTTEMCVVCVYTFRDRAADAPYMGSAGNVFTLAGRYQPSGLTGIVEIWYYMDTTHSVGLTAYVPNTNNFNLTVIASLWNVPAGYEFEFECYDQNTATSTNPTVTVSPWVADSVIIDALLTEASNVATLSATDTELDKGDMGSWGYGSQYYIATSGTSRVMDWTHGTSAQWANIGAAFHEIVTPSPSTRNRIILTH